MNNNFDDLIKTISTQLITYGHHKITIVFHAGYWKDIFIKNLSDDNGTEVKEISETGFIDRLCEHFPYPEYGEVEYELWFNGNVQLYDYRLNETHRIHCNKG